MGTGIEEGAWVSVLDCKANACFLVNHGCHFFEGNQERHQHLRDLIQIGFIKRRKCLSFLVYLQKPLL
jgi:hypothetical protein